MAGHVSVGAGHNICGDKSLAPFRARLLDAASAPPYEDHQEGRQKSDEHYPNGPENV